MARKSNEDRQKARGYVLDTLGLSERDVKAWIKAKNESDRCDNTRRDHYHKERDVVREARIAKGSDYPELTDGETKAALATVPACTVTKEQSDAARLAYNKIDDKIKSKRRVYCIVRNVSSSGMSRVISLHVIRDDSMRHLSYNVATMLGSKYSDKHGGVVIGGCGMDMCFALVYELSSKLFGNGYLLRAETI
jgi:hypothetical protein